MGCNCNSNNRCNGVLSTMQTGDTYRVYVNFSVDGEPVELALDCDLIVGFYDTKKNPIVHGSLSGGRVVGVGGQYYIEVSHEESLLMRGKVLMELTVTKANGTKVYHADKVVTIGFEPRNNNNIIDNGNI